MPKNVNEVTQHLMKKSEMWRPESIGRERMYSFNIIHIVFLECKSNSSLMVGLEERSGVIRTM